jgi:hypothetical protein
MSAATPYSQHNKSDGLFTMGLTVGLRGHPTMVFIMGFFMGLKVDCDNAFGWCLSNHAF